jgi:hypothetical protein
MELLLNTGLTTRSELVFCHSPCGSLRSAHLALTRDAVNLFLL